MITSFFTCQRQPAYIGDTLSSYFDHFTDVPLVFETGNVQSYLNRTKVQRVQSNAGLSCVLHWMFVVDWLYHNTNQEWYMICEDDIQFRQKPQPLGFVSLKNLGFISAYCARPNRHPREKGWQELNYKDQGFYGSLCIILSRESLSHIVLNFTEFYSYTKNGKHLDTAIGEFFRGKKNYNHTPTLVLHIGEVSTYDKNYLIADSPARQPAL